MFAVIENGVQHYLGNDAEEALEIFRSKPGSKMVNVNDLEELRSQLNEDMQLFHTVDEAEEYLSGKLSNVLERLKEQGFNGENAEEFRKKLVEGSEKLAADVRSLGIRGMRIVGDGLSSLGDFLRKSSDKEVTAQSTDQCCDNEGCCEHRGPQHRQHDE